MGVRRSEIGQRAELYGSAYKLAWEQIPPPERRRQPDLSLRIYASVRRQVKEGAMDPISIASAALKEVLDSKRRRRRAAFQPNDRR
jgi:hypothetical protein